MSFSCLAVERVAYWVVWCCGHTTLNGWLRLFKYVKWVSIFLPIKKKLQLGNWNKNK